MKDLYDFVTMCKAPELTTDVTLQPMRRMLQGNLDPAVLCASRETVIEEAGRGLKLGGGQRHVFDLGQRILPDIPIENIYALVETVKNHQVPAR